MPCPCRRAIDDSIHTGRGAIVGCLHRRIQNGIIPPIELEWEPREPPRDFLRATMPRAVFRVVEVLSLSRAPAHRGHQDIRNMKRIGPSRV